MNNPRSTPGIRTRTRLWLALCLVLVPTVATAQSADEPRMSLDQVIEAALQVSPQVAQAAGSIEEAVWGERVARAAYLPSLSVSTSTSRSSSERLDPITNTLTSSGASSYSAGLSSSIDIYTGGQRRAEIVRSRSSHTAAEATLVEQRFAVTLTAKRSYFDVLRADDMIRVAEARVERAQDGLTAAERLSEAGSGTRSDVLRAQLELTNARQSLLEAKTQRRDAAFTLGQIVGIEGPVGAKEAELDGPKPLALTHDELVELALRQSPRVQSAEANRGVADATARSARAQFLPTVSASGGYNWSNTELNLGTGRKGWSLSMGVSYPIFNRFQRIEASSRASVRAEVAQLELADARRATRAELEQLLAAIELAEQQIELADESVDVAEEDLRVQSERYRLGVSTILDQLSSQLALVEAENDRIAARHNYQMARAELEALLGREL